MWKFTRLIVIISLVGITIICSVLSKAALPADKSTTIDSLPSDSSAVAPGDTLAQDEVEPVMIYEAIPIYPEEAQRHHFEAHLTIQAFVGSNGVVKKAKAIDCSRPGWGFEQAAVDAALKCRYKPAQQKGKTIGVWVTYKVSFRRDRH